MTRHEIQELLHSGLTDREIIARLPIIAGGGPALEIIMVQDTAPGASITAMTAQAPGSLTIRNTPFQADVRLVSMWAYQNVAGIFRVHSPRMHDNVDGIRQQVLATTATPMLPARPVQKLFPQDALIAENTGSGVGGQIEIGMLLVYYSELPGVNARFITPDELMRRGVNYAGVEIDTTPGVAGGWSGASALNKTRDFLKANTDYAIVGYTLSAAAAGIAIVGPDTGNLYVGGPAQTPEFELLQEWFVRISRVMQTALIPVVNSANKAGTTLYIAQNQAGTAVNVSLTLVELAPGGATSPTAPGPAR
jgi:hypothetical protein